MDITAISDLHGYMPELPGGDLLIVAGDCTARDISSQWIGFFTWFADQKYTHKILVAGNHDGFLTKGISSLEADRLGLPRDEWYTYLCDSGTVVNGLKIYGMPWTPPFCNWDFMLAPAEMAVKCALIPADVDILVSHGPAYGILDECPRCFGGGKKMSVGCHQLRARLEIVKPKLHIFGHIHEDGFKSLVLKDWGPNNTLSMNVAIMDGSYQPRKGHMRCVYQDSSFTPLLIQTPQK